MTAALTLDEAFGPTLEQVVLAALAGASPSRPFGDLPGLRWHHAPAGRCLVRSAGAKRAGLR